MVPVVDGELGKSQEVFMVLPNSVTASFSLWMVCG
jgi:hypothetical protein